jgi:putative membrane protein insertion efficiency factor
LGKKFILLTLRAYRAAVSPLLPGACRFYPSCSAYAEEAVGRFGVLRGLRIAAVRLLHCHPGHPGGHDPIPE